MKILIISSLYPPHIIGGAEKAAAELAEAMVHNGHSVVVVSLHPGTSEIVEDRNGVRVYRLPIHNFMVGRQKKPSPLVRLAWHVREIWNRVARRIGKILDAEKPDVVNSHNVCGFSLAAWSEVKRRKMRLVHTVHDCYLLCSRSVLFRNGKNCKRRCLDCKVLTFNRRNLSRLPDSLVSVSEYTLKEHVTRHYFEGVAATVIRNIHGTIGSPLRQALNNEKTSNDLIFGFIGRVEEEKGIETLLVATRQLKHSNWRLKIAGKGLGYTQKLSERFSDPRIEWLGFTSAADFYASVDVIVIPSLLNEALPYACVESLHAGKNLICALSGGIPEIAVLSNIVEFFPAGNTGALAEKMNIALSSLEVWRERKLPETSSLEAFREEYVVEKYLREYAPPKATDGYA